MKDEQGQDEKEIIKWMELCLEHSKMEFEGTCLLRDIFKEMGIEIKRIQFSFLNTQIRKGSVELILKDSFVKIGMTIRLF